MNDLTSMFGGGTKSGGQQQSEMQDFVDRFQQGSPTEGYSDQEAVQRFQQVAPQLPPQEFQASAQQAFERLSPEQRMQLGQQLIQSAQQQGVRVSQPQGGNYQDPQALAQMVTNVHQQSPGLLPQLLGAGRSSGGQVQSGAQGGGMLSNPIAKAALAGIAAMAAQRMFSRR